jgi:hypothetical protein
MSDVGGPNVTDLKPGANDVREPTQGVYLVRAKGSKGQGVEDSSGRKVTVAR